MPFECVGEVAARYGEQMDCKEDNVTPVSFAASGILTSVKEYLVFNSGNNSSGLRFRLLVFRIVLRLYACLMWREVSAR